MKYWMDAATPATLDGIDSQYPNGLYEGLRELIDASREVTPSDPRRTNEAISEVLFAFNQIFGDGISERHPYTGGFALELGIPSVPGVSQFISAVGQVQNYLHRNIGTDRKIGPEHWDKVVSLLGTDSIRVALSMKNAVSQALNRARMNQFSDGRSSSATIQLPSFETDPKKPNYIRSHDESVLITLSEDTEKPLNIDAVYTFFLTNGYTPDSVIARMLPDMDTIESRGDEMMRKYFQCLSRTDNFTVLQTVVDCYKNPDTRNKEKGSKIVYLRLALIDTPAGMVQGGLNGMRGETVTEVFPSVAITVENAGELMRAYCRYHKRGMDPTSIDAINYLHTEAIRKRKEDWLRILGFDMDLLREEFVYSTHYAPPSRYYLSSIEEAKSIVFALTKACELIIRDDSSNIPAPTPTEQNEVFGRLLKLTNHMMLGTEFHSVQAAAARALITLLSKYNKAYDPSIMDTLQRKSTLSRNHYEPHLSSLFYTGN